MNNSQNNIETFFNSKNTTDFVVRANEYYINEIQNYPFVKVTQLLADYYIVGYVDNNDIEKLADALGTNFYSSLPYVVGLLDRSALESSGIIQVQEQAFLELTGKGVLVGIVDTGIDYTNPIFRYEDGTSRIAAIYDQTIAGNPPKNFLVGTEYTNRQINEALQESTPYDIVPSRDEVGHGTFLASLAAGRESGSFRGAAPDSELIVVKLKEAGTFIRNNYLVPEDNRNVYESTSVMLGIEYILQKARELNKPVAICLGVGTNLGSHDGTTIFEQYISTVSNITGVCVCAAAGNESQERHHARVTLTERGSQVDININNEKQDSGIYMSILNSASDRVSVSLRSPTGEIISRTPARAGTTYTSRLVLEKAKVTVQYFFPLSVNSGQATIIKIENATEGLWTVTLYGDIILDGTVDAYLPISSIGYEGIEFLEPDPYYTITVPGTSSGVITCGAYNDEDNSLYINTSWGPTRLPATAPDLVAPGVRVTGIFPTGEGIMSGTSVATAITTGACALMLQWGIVEGNAIALDTFQIKGYLIRGCERDDSRSYPNFQWGYGKLDLYNTFNLIRDV
ncbi:MAG: S8 family peptidase [Clostridia bacterium]|nr:S8 family peptidase [Clostridia bacterium]